jgi:hypothetical protein
MAIDADKLRAKLKESGLFSDAEIDAEVFSAQKDDKAEERRAILNTQKVEAPVVAQSSPAIAAAPAAAVAAPVPAAAVPSVAQPITSATTPAQLFDMRPKGTPVERIGANINEAAAAAGPAVANVASNATQDSLNYARDAIANNPELTGALAAIPVLYGANKLGLFDNLGSKMSASAAQPQPFVGGSGPRVTPPVTAPMPQPQAWDIHSDPSFGNFLGGSTAPATPAVTPAATTPAAAPSRNLTLEEAQARLAGVTPSAAPTRNVTAGITPAPKPAAGEFVGPMQPVGPPEFTGPRRPVVPTPPAALATTTAPVTPTAAPVPPPTGELRTGAGLPAYAGEGKQYQRMPKEFASVKEVPAGYAFVPGVGPGTNTIRNLETPEGYKAAVQLHGGPFGSHDEAVDFMNKYNAEQRMGPPADRALRKSLGLPLQENTKGIPMKGVKVAGIAGAVMAMSDVANAFNSSVRTGNAGPLMETAFDIGISAIPGVRAAATGLTGSTLQSGKLFKEDRDYSEVLNRPGVRQVLDNMSKIMTPDQFNVEADKYLSKLSSFPQYNSSRFIKPAIGSTQPINRTTLLPIAPPAR